MSCTLVRPNVAAAHDANALTTVDSEEELLAGVGSAASDETDTTLVSGVAATGVTMIVMVAVAAFARDAMVQVTTPLACPQVAPGPIADTKLTPFGSVSIAV